jgi:hypothetical protein
MVAKKSPEAPSVQGLNCPSCGAAIALRAGGHTVTVTCAACNIVLDAKDPNVRVLQKMAKHIKVDPRIPLGTRGKVKGEPYEVVGFQVRAITVAGLKYAWREYLLWNPYKGFRYLTEYDGHWNDVIVSKTKPERRVSGDHPVVDYLGQTLRHFQTAQARTEFILGEFPWRVKVGDMANVRDYVAPPYILSEESTDGETTWSVGTYVAPERVWEWFKLPSRPPGRRGVYANQPNPQIDRWRGLRRAFGVLGAVLAFALVARFATAQRKDVFVGRYAFYPAVFAHERGADSTAFVTPVFEVSGRTSNLELRIDTDITNGWAYFNLALINDSTGAAADFGREVSYYYGRDHDGAWSEGSPKDVSYLPSVPPGLYYLRVEPEGDRQFKRLVGYTLRLRRDVPRPRLYLAALLILAFPPLLAGVRSWGFENARWSESDYASDDDE